MKRLIAAAVFALAALAALIPTTTPAAGNVYVNNGEVCSGSVQMDLTAAGDVAIVCTAPGTPTTTPPPTGGGGGSSATCPTSKAVFGSFADRPTLTPVIQNGKSAAIALPIYAAASGAILISGAETTLNLSTSVQFAVTKCPGDFTVTDPHCSVTKTQSGNVLNAIASATPVSGKCTLDLNTQYYLNVRFVKSDNVTPSCAAAAGTCSVVIGYHD